MTATAPPGSTTMRIHSAFAAMILLAASLPLRAADIAVAATEVEASTFESLEALEGLLNEVSRLCESGFSGAEAHRLAAEALKLKKGEGLERTYVVSCGGVSTPLRVKLSVLDLLTPNVHVFSSRKVAERVTKIMADRQREIQE